MKFILNRVRSIALLAVVLLLCSACPAAAASEQETEGAMEASLVSTAESLSQAIVELSQDEINSYKVSGDEFTVSVMEAWESNREELGEFKNLGKSETEKLADGYSVTVFAQFSNYNAEMVYLYDETGVPTSFSLDIQYPMTVLLQRAGLNTLMGLGIVFLMLVFLTLVISLFRYVGKIEEKGQPGEKVIPEPELIQPQFHSQPVVREKNNQELIAVIAAAIAAYEGTSEDSFVVRSIRRANRGKNRW